MPLSVINRRLNDKLSRFNKSFMPLLVIFVKLHDCAPADPKHRGIFGTSGFLYNRKVAEKIVKWDTNHLIDNTHKYLAIDEFFNKVIEETVLI